jgi:hypothetical protein
MARRFTLKPSPDNQGASLMRASSGAPMRSRSFHLHRSASLIFALGLALPVFAQDGPLPPAPASQPAPPVTQAPPAPAPPAPQVDAAQPSADATSSAKAAPAVTPTAPAAKVFVRVPSGTHLPLVLHNAISTKSTRPGDPVYFETLFPIVIDGHVVIPAGSYVSGEVTETKRPGRVKGRAELMIKLNEMILPNGYMVNLNAVPSNAGTGGGETTNSEGQIVGDSDKASDIGTIAKTTAAGAGIGSIATRSVKGAGIGAGVGAAVGLMTVLLTRGPEAEMPRGTTVEAVLDRPVFLDADKVQFTSPGQASTLAGPPNREPQRSKVPF